MFELPDISPELLHSNITKDVLLIFLIKKKKFLWQKKKKNTGQKKKKKFFLTPHRARGILIPQPRTKLTSPALGGQS